MKQKQNKIVNSMDQLLNKKQNLKLEYKRLQRQRDLKVDTLNQKFGNKIDNVLREAEFVDMQIDQARKYANSNLKCGSVKEDE